MPTEAEILAEQNIEKRVEFDERQQKKVNDLIQEAMGRAGKEARTEATEVKAQLTLLRTELDQAKTDLANAKTIHQKGEASADIVALEARLNEMQTAHKTVQTELENTRNAAKQKDVEIKRANDAAINIRKEITLTQAASKINPFEVDEVVRSSKDSIAWDADKSKFVVVDPISQQPRLNSAFEPMTIDEYFAEFAAKKPYMVRSGLRSGTGSSETNNGSGSMNGKYTIEQIFGKGSNSKLAGKLSVEDPKEYARLRALAKQAGRVA